MRSLEGLYISTVVHFSWGTGMTPSIVFEDMTNSSPNGLCLSILVWLMSIGAVCGGNDNQRNYAISYE